MWIDEQYNKALPVAKLIGFDLQSIADKKQACDSMYDYIKAEIKNRALFDEHDLSVSDWYSSYGLKRSISGVGRIMHASR